MKRYKDISKLYNIKSIEKDFILTNYKGIDTRIYIYKIEPIVILGLSEEEKENILTIYKELLKQVNFDFQIVMLNSKLDIDLYVQNLVTQTGILQVKNMNLKNKYINDIKDKLIKENIYETDYYIAISISYNMNTNFTSIDNVIKKLDKIGCTTKKVCGKNNLQNLLFKCINKL